jgi:hypothetical protein
MHETAKLLMKFPKRLIIKEKTEAPSVDKPARPAFGFSVFLALGVFFMAQQPVQAEELTLGGYLIEEAVEDSVEETVEESVEESVAENTENSVEESVEDAVLDAVEEQIEEETLTLGGYLIEEAVEDTLEESLEESIADAVEDAVEEDVAVTVEENVEQDLEENLEDIIEDSVEESVAEAVEDNVEESVAEAVEDNVEDSVADTIEEGVEQEVADSVEGEVEQEVADSVEESVEQSVADSVEDDVEVEVAQEVEQEVQDGLQQAVELEIAAAAEERLESKIDVILEGVESEFEIDEDRIHKDQWLVMAEPEVFEKLAVEGYLFDKVTELPGIGMRLAEVAAPSSFDITEVRQGVMDVLGTDHAEVDLNHIYTAGAPVMATDEGVSPRAAIHFPADTEQLPLRIGIIDSLVDASHPSLMQSNITSRSFAPKGATLPDAHGTAIASIIVGSTAEYQGIAPNTQLYAAAVFEKDPKRGEIASTVSLVMGLDWLISSGVDAVNISLAGPPNRLLQAALTRAAEQDVIILAAAGNGGPVAKPMYPAAYDSVVAITAVDSSGQVFRLANRGEYLDLAAPGVSLRHAKAGGGYTASSGTSFAVPFVATAAARIRQLHPDEDVLAVLYQSAEDLGPPGRDEIYGYGLLRPDAPLITSGERTASR